MVKVAIARAVTENWHKVLRLTFKDRPILQAVVSGETAHQRAIDPIVKNTADIFAGSSCHCGKVTLGDLLLNYDTPLPHITTELVCKSQHRARNTTFDGKKARSRHRIVGVAQPVRQQGREVTIEFRSRPPLRLEGAAAHEAQFRIAQRYHRSRARRPVDHGQFTHD